MQKCQSLNCDKLASRVGETRSGPKHVCSAKCLVDVMRDMKIDGEAGDELAKRIVQPKTTIAFDFDMTMTAEHSCMGKKFNTVVDMSDFVNSAALGELLLWMKETNRLNWIISFGNIGTIRLTMAASGLADFFRVPVAQVPSTIREHKLYERMVENGYFWRVLTPSVLLGLQDCVRPDRNFYDLYKISFMNMALNMTNAFLSSENKEQLNPRELMLIDDTEENVNQCARAGYSGLAINSRKQLSGSLAFADAADKKKKSGSDEDWLQTLFKDAKLVEKVGDSWGNAPPDKWNYYKIE